MAQQMDSLFSAELLSDDQCLFTAFALLRANFSSIYLDGNLNPSQNPFECLIEFAKFALFYCQVLRNSADTMDDTSFCYALIVSTFVDHFKLRATKARHSQMLLRFSKEFDFPFSFPSMPSADGIAKSLLHLSQNEDGCCFPFCAFYSLLKFSFSAVLSPQIPFDRSPIRTIFEIVIQMRSDLNSDLNVVLDLLPHEPTQNAEECVVLRWLAEFEWRCANLTEENRAEHFVALATFIEQHRKGVEDWLFTVRKDDLFRNLFGCVILKFCAQIVPFVAEVGAVIRDFVNCALITVLQNCTENLFSSNDRIKECDDEIAMHWLLMGHSALNLVIRYENVVRMNRQNGDYREIAREWAEFFGPSAANYVFHWFLHFSNIGKMPPQFFTKTLCNAIQSIDIDRLIKAEIPIEFLQRATDCCPEDELSFLQIFEGYSDERRSRLLPTSVLFFNSLPEIQFASATVLKGFLFEMFSSENAERGAFAKKSLNGNELESEANEGDTEDIGKSLEEQSHQLALPRLFKALLSFEFANYSRLNESEVDPLLLSWDVLMRFFGDLDVLSRVRFCDAIDVKTLSNASPPPPRQNYFLFASSDAICVVSHVDDLFTGPFHYKLVDRPFDREHFTSNLFFRTLATIPALFREWHGTLSKTEANTVNEYTQKYLSHLLIQRELRSLENMKRGRLEVRILSKVREIECTYRLEETTMTLTILLPENYPIKAPKVETGRSIVNKELHRKWLLQLGVFLNGQNGVMMDGILQWKRSIDQHLQGVEECTICMSTVSSTNYQLPKIRCRQCRKKFHGDCLYKWFQSSSKSSCPLCRANFV
ncbi:hypothetical protein niasHT_023471 [Heterodera trifolii]|uniref:E3 ubiquitin-protein ligase listerin n=1 Tax=Heterodera trifolii TaxID=157864 RepID=A0ABD2JJ30_9BILA